MFDMSFNIQWLLLYVVIVIIAIPKSHISFFGELLSCNNLVIILKCSFPSYKQTLYIKIIYIISEFRSASEKFTEVENYFFNWEI